MQISTNRRVLCLHAAAKRLGIPERTLRHRASRGRVPGAFKQGKLWKFFAEALPTAFARRPDRPDTMGPSIAACSQNCGPG
jgi:hypothetical protein